MKQKEKIEMFKQFLKDNGCYKKYKIELYRKKKIKINISCKYHIHNMEKFISSAFVWENTEQGYFYWERLNIKWRDLINATR